MFPTPEGGISAEWIYDACSVELEFLMDEASTRGSWNKGFEDGQKDFTDDREAAAWIRQAHNLIGVQYTPTTKDAGAL